jgi:hypothetical protein
MTAVSRVLAVHLGFGSCAPRLGPCALSRVRVGCCRAFGLGVVARLVAPPLPIHHTSTLAVVYTIRPSPFAVLSTVSTMPVHQFTCPVCARAYTRDGWLVRHIATDHPRHDAGARVRSRSPPPADTGHSRHGISDSHNHAPLVEDVLMHDAPAVDAGLPVADDGTAGARIERFPGAGDPVPPPDDAADHAQRAVDPGLPSPPTDDATSGKKNRVATQPRRGVRGPRVGRLRSASTRKCA